MKITELLVVMESNQYLFITVYTKAHTRHYYKGIASRIIESMFDGTYSKEEVLDLNSKVLYVCTYPYSSTIYIDAREEHEDEV